MKLSHDKNIGLLILRLVLAYILITAGYMKLSDMGATIGFFGSLGFGPFLAYFVAIVEFVGGLSVLFGYASKAFAALLSVILLVAVYEVYTHNGFGSPEGISFPLMTLGGTLALVFTGPGKYGFGEECGCPVKKGGCKMCKGSETSVQ